MKKTQADLVKGWILKAKSDLADAQRTIESEGPYDTACFHCQQAAEKFLKAFLASHDHEIPRTHDIEELFLLCVKLEPGLKELVFPAEELSSYAVEMRYDTDFWPDRETAANALKTVRNLWEALQKMLPEIT